MCSMLEEIIIGAILGIGSFLLAVGVLYMLLEYFDFK